MSEYSWIWSYKKWTMLEKAVADTNIILRHLISNDLAVSYRYLGTRQDKKAFKASVFIKVVLVINFAPMELLPLSE
ncbi:unnamed protein product [Acanthoscelides obtectus]|uniref:Uncharacterized protein n=1 Tax=Acanthoscelides obtectus TaxID=200917 RepID=A0A9P0LLZ3_ACAOB|nr:unnamed protein product [Acanthoscelides obtectus]CAK1624131.1 hypothetical protein AOBTE_LOCUS2340 [Acanthoscelides obtectus]